MEAPPPQEQAERGRPASGEAAAASRWPRLGSPPALGPGSGPHLLAESAQAPRPRERGGGRGRRNREFMAWVTCFPLPQWGPATLNRKLMRGAKFNLFPRQAGSSSASGRGLRARGGEWSLPRTGAPGQKLISFRSHRRLGLDSTLGPLAALLDGTSRRAAETRLVHSLGPRCGSALLGVPVPQAA